MRIACLGDSCTFGQNVRQDRAWPHLLWAMTGHDVRNLGVNGDTTRLGLERWHRDIDLVDPDLVVIQFGHNDVNEWHGQPRVALTAYVANIDEMISRARHTLVLSPHTPIPPKSGAYLKRLVDYRSALAVEPLAIDVLDDGYGCHPSPAGHRMYAEYVASLL